MSQRYFAQISPGLEDVLRAELKELGARRLKLDEGGVHFEGTRKHLYRVLLQSRLASRVYQTLTEGGAPQRDALFARIVKIDWTQYIPAKSTPLPLAIRASVSATHTIEGTGEVESVVFNAVERALRGQRVIRSCPWSSDEPDLTRLLVRVHQGRVTVRIDAAGDLMHRRGWRMSEGAAPLRPTLAATLLRLLAWDLEEPLYDPMCGSGTIPIEAARWASRRSPRLWTRYACSSWPSFDSELWEREVKLLGSSNVSEDDQSPAQLHAHIFASDRDTKAIAMTQSHLVSAHELVQVWTHDARQLTPPTDQPGLLIFNPPYGLRVKEGDELKAVLHTFAQHRDQWLGWRLGIIYPRQLTPPHVDGLTMTELARFQHGGLPVWVWRYQHESSD